MSSVEQELAWPTVQGIEASNDSRGAGGMPDGDDHLLVGISISSAKDFLIASGWPDDYQRSEEDVRRNGPLTKGNEIGYDVAHIGEKECDGDGVENGRRRG